MIRLNLNGRDIDVDSEPDTPLLWVIRESLKLTGSKFGCGVGECGACMVHLNGVSTRSCITPIDAVDGAAITTIEGLSPDGDHKLLRAWVAEQTPQCGYCQSGQIMRAADLLSQNPKPNREEIIDFMSTNLCRCGSYPDIIRAIERAAAED